MVANDLCGARLSDPEHAQRHVNLPVPEIDAHDLIANVVFRRPLNERVKVNHAHAHAPHNATRRRENEEPPALIHIKFNAFLRIVNSRASSLFPAKGGAVVPPAQLRPVFSGDS
jgi:hypothetical protein